MILLVVFIVIVMISLAGLSFVELMSTENKAVHLHGDEIQAQAALRSGEELLKFFLEQTPDVRQAAAGTFDNPDLFRGTMVLEDPAEKHNCRVTVISPRLEEGEVRGIRYGVDDESSRLNLASVLDWEQRHPGDGKQALLRLPGMTENIADAILDWMDGDSESRQMGAEADYYSALMVPYGPRNAVPTSIEELLLVKGVTRELLFGVDWTDRPFDVAALYSASQGTAGPPTGTMPSAADLPWVMLLTVYSAEKNVTPVGTPKINLNDPDLARLSQRLAAAFDAPTAQFVVAYRQFGPYAGVEASIPGAPFQADLKLPARFTIDSPLDLIAARVRAQALGSIVLDSPFTGESSATREVLSKILDLLTTDSGPVIRGRINVNLAPTLVLGCIPGIDDGLVTRIVSARGTPDAPDTVDRHNLAWLVTEGLVDLPQLKALLPYLTTGGDVYRAQIIGYFDDKGPSARAEVIIDATSTPSREVYWKDLKMLGPGYPPEALGGSPSDAAAFLPVRQTGQLAHGAP
jgi:type II secretory pathway component PulK